MLHINIYITCSRLNSGYNNSGYNIIKAEFTPRAVKYGYVGMISAKIKTVKSDEGKSKLLMSFTESSGKLRRSKE